MKRKILLPITAMALCTGFLFAGCSDDIGESLDEKLAKASSTTQTTAADETEASSESEASEESKFEYPKCEVSNTKWSETGVDRAGMIEGTECTNVTNLLYKFDYTDDSDYSYTKCTVERDGELLYEQNRPLYWVYISDEMPVHVNEFGYLPSGEYKVTIYNGDEVISEGTMNVTFDEATAEQLPIISINQTEEYSLAAFFTSEAHDMHPKEYTAGGDGIYCLLMASGINEDSVCKCEMFVNGESKGTIEPTEVTTGEARYTIDGPVPSGTIVLNFYVDDVLKEISTITVK